MVIRVFNLRPVCFKSFHFEIALHYIDQRITVKRANIDAKVIRKRLPINISQQKPVRVKLLAKTMKPAYTVERDNKAAILFFFEA